MSSPAVLVARFLKASGYDETLATFLQEAGLPSDTGSTSEGDLTIEQILQEKNTFDLSVNFEKLGIEEADKRWRQPAPSIPLTVKTLPTASNILNSSVQYLPDQDQHGISKPYVLATTADRRLHVVAPNPPSFDVLKSLTTLLDSPILSYVILGGKYILCGGMSGKVVLYDFQSQEMLDERRDHAKYIVKIAAHPASNGSYLATAGWDARVLLYRTQQPESGKLSLGSPIASIELTTNPEALVFVAHPAIDKPVLLVTRRDSSFLYYYTMPDSVINTDDRPPGKLELLGKQNLAPHSNAWVAFTPSAVELCPTDPTLLAVATSAVPHMRLIIVRILLPLSKETLDLPDPQNTSATSLLDRVDEAPATQTIQARRALAIQDREAAAILIQCSTFASQTPYSTPALAWRPNGSGVWVNSDDGTIRGVEANTGKIVANLAGHEPGSKVRCLWAGRVEVDGHQEEWLISGGFDQRLIVWRNSV